MIRDSVTAVAQELMGAEISALIGVERGERTEDCATHLNGYWPRRWDTRAEEIELQIPKIDRALRDDVASARAATSHHFCSPASALRRRWCRWCSRRTSAA